MRIPGIRKAVPAAGVAAAWLLASAGMAYAGQIGSISSGTVVLDPPNLPPIDINFADETPVDCDDGDVDATIEITATSSGSGNYSTLVNDADGVSTIQFDLNNDTVMETYIATLSLATGFPPPSQVGALTALGGGLYDLEQDIALRFSVVQVNPSNDCAPTGVDCQVNVVVTDAVGVYDDAGGNLPTLTGVAELSSLTSGSVVTSACDAPLSSLHGSSVTIDALDPLVFEF